VSYKSTLLVAVLLVTANASEQRNVTIESVVKHTNSDHQPIYAVKYSYSFPPDETVEIEGIGRVRSSGSMEYYTKGTAVKIVHGGTTESFPLPLRAKLRAPTT